MPPPRSRRSVAALEAAQPLPSSPLLEADLGSWEAPPPEPLPAQPSVEEAPPSGAELEPVPADAPPVFVGVDGGGSRTRLVIADASGNILGKGEAGGSNINFVGEAALRRALSDAWRAAWKAAGAPPRPARAAFLGLAGVSSAGAHETVRLMASQIGIAQPDDIGVDHDISVALAGAFDGRPGIALVVGTGSACFGTGAAGQHAQSGGYGPIIDDGGSGYWLGRMALRATVFAADGRGPKTTLSEAVFRQLDITEVRGIAQRLYREHISRESIAALAPAVIAAAEARDPVAMMFCTRGAEDLAAMVGAVARSLELKAPGVALIGSAGNNAYYRGLIETAVKLRVSGAHFPVPAQSPEGGALLLAFRQAKLEMPRPLAA